MNVAESEILITGGGSGVGRHLVERFASCARRVAVLEKDADAMADLSAALPHVKCYACDVTQPDEISQTLDALASDGFRINVLVNNAGLIYSAPLVNLLAKPVRVHSTDMWQTVLAANLSSVFFVTARVIDRMLSEHRQGIVINLSSISSQGNAGQTAYSAAKAGVNALTLTWGKELGPLGFRFAAIAPGFLDTPSTRRHLSKSMLERVKQNVPLRRLGTPAAVFQAVQFVIENDYVNGVVLEIDGGLVL